MDKPSLSARIRYWFDNVMARGNVAIIGLLGLISLAWVLVAGLVAWIFGIFPGNDGGGEDDLGIIEATWRQLTFTLDPGTFSGDVGPAWRILSLLTTLFGLLVVASLIGVVSAAFDDRITQLRKGRSAVLETNHTVILGWSNKVFTIISELVVANESERRPAVVVLADRDRVDMEDLIREKVPNTKNTRVVCRSGDPLDQDELLRANPYAARSIIVLGDEDAADADSATIKTALALTNHPARPDRPIHVVGEIRNPANLGVAELVGKDEAQWVLPLETISKLTVQTCRQSGLSRVYSELLQFDGDEMYFTDQPTLVGKSFLDCQLHFVDVFCRWRHDHGGRHSQPAKRSRARDGGGSHRDRGGRLDHRARRSSSRRCRTRDGTRRRGRHSGASAHHRLTLSVAAHHLRARRIHGSRLSRDYRERPQVAQAGQPSSTSRSTCARARHGNGRCSSLSSRRPTITSLCSPTAITLRQSPRTRAR